MMTPASSWTSNDMGPLPELIENDEFVLRQLQEADVTDRYLAWFRDADVTRYLESRNLRREDVVEFMRKGETTGQYRVYAIIAKDSGLHIGNVKLGPIVRESGVSDLVTIIGDRSYWRRGIATRAIKLGTKLAFDLVGLRKLSGAIYSANTGSIRAYSQAGWIVEAVLHEHLFREGKIMDRVLISCFNPKYFPELPTFPRPIPSY